MIDPVDITFDPTLEAVEQAREIVQKTTRVTLLDSAKFLQKFTDGQVYLKCENMQRTGSYKIRGATYRLAQLSEEQRVRGVVAASAGNHAQGVAFAARELGIKATIFMPTGVPIPKLEATRNYGADVVLEGDDVAAALLGAQRFAEETGAVFIHPYNHPDIITGQGTLALDLYEQLPQIDTIIVPIGGGGLAAGLGATAKHLAEKTGQKVRVIGVQAENSAPFPVSVAEGHPVKIDAKPTIADGIAVDVPGSLSFELVRKYVDEIVTVSEDDISRAILLLLERAKLVVEAAGATTVAAIIAGKIKESGNTVAVLSGGNIDPMMLEKVIASGLTASERYMKLNIGLRDTPGHLARIAAILADINANVIEVLHTRHNKGLQIQEVELEIAVETRGSDHAAQVLERLREAGYNPRVDPNASL
ncbi:threonine ammonia-lyase [Gulosibacter chungangensis]|uniref:L-threonine dehydratase catabolic TdcB n=1 Tax=Gulosibacter chungangensis TaxID=979746 RepID=A0A7J5BDF0_9MICO|nr:threonine ammonia-lyase [Gulosibacter chungangensis]KAB1643257.1 threonine ammonia-lyase [Gulosibacter chungangensis]